MKLNIHRSSKILETPRVAQLLGLFDVPPSERSEREWVVNLPIEEKPWQIGLIIGPSGSGKSTLSREAFPNAPAVSANHGYDWPADRSIVDGFPEGLSIKDITGTLSSVGFSSPPSWVRPFQFLSTGEQFRATVVRALLDPAPLVVLDEFTSVVDRTVAQIGSAAVAKAVRRTQKQIVCVTCHYDVEEWLCPDWTIEMPDGKFAWRSLRRPSIQLEIRRVRPSAWKLFKDHHYLNRNLHKAARCFVAYWNGQPVAFTSVIHSMPASFREHRTVCLPDFQGVGIGNALSEYVAGVMRAKKKYTSTTSNPAMIRHRMQSKNWKLIRKPAMARPETNAKNSKDHKIRKMSKALNKSHATNRLTASFEYIGPKFPEDLQRFGVA